MRRDFSDLNQEPYDLIIIGGGIVGSGIARDAALRGLRTLLVEKEDYAAGTTSSSTRLIHGGLRYLRQLEWKLVRQDLRERETLLHIAPHLVRPLTFIIPLIRSQPLFRYTLPLGLRLYDFLARGKSLPSWKRLNLAESLAAEPSVAAVSGLVGSCVYHDCQAEYMERLCLENVIDAARLGGTMLNHAEMTGFQIAGNATQGIQVRDKLSGETYSARGRVIVNAGGPWADVVLGKASTRHTYGLRKTKGVHLLTKQLSHGALVLFARSDHRLFFVIPWGDYSLIGTTDTDYSGDLDNVRAEQADIDYLVSETRNYFRDFSSDDVYLTTAGLRPLVPRGDKAESNLSRAHTLVDHERKDGLSGLISVFGGKITAYRAIAEEAVDLVCSKLGRPTPCRTAETPLPGAPVPAQAELESAASEYNLAEGTVSHLAELYGSRFLHVLELAETQTSLKQPVTATHADILAQVHHAVREEQALTLGDFILRRSALWVGPDQGRDSVNAVALEMGTLLGWSESETQQQKDDFLSRYPLPYRRNGAG